MHSEKCDNGETLEDMEDIKQAGKNQQKERKED